MKKLSILILFLFVIGCVGGPDGGQAVSNICDYSDAVGFQVDEVEVNFERTPDPAGYVLPSNFTLRFKARVTEGEKLQPMRYANFEIHTFENKNKSLGKQQCDKAAEWECFKTTTDAQGDITWTENFSFPLRVEQQWIRFERVITNLDGKVIVSLMVNPWLKDSDIKVYDIRKHNPGDYTDKLFNQPHPLPKNISSAERFKKCIEARSLEKSFDKLLKDSSQTPFLWANDVNLKLTKVSISQEAMRQYNVCLDGNSPASCDSLGVFFEMELDIPVAAIHKSSTGGVDFHRVEDGKFEVKPYLISVKDSETFEGVRWFHRLRSPIESRVTSSEEGLKVKEIIHVPYKTNIGSLMLFLKISEKENNQIGAFYGVYDFGNLPGEKWHGHEKQADPFRFKNSSSANSSNIVEYRGQLERYRKQFGVLAQDFEKYNPKGDENFERASSLDVDLERIRFVRVKASGTQPETDCESVVKRTVIYFGSACLPDPMTGSMYSDTPVKIYTSDMEIKRDPKHSLAGQDQDWPIIITEKQQRELIHAGQTDHKGCVQFTYQLEHNVYDIQEYFMKKLTFELADYAGRQLTEDHYVAFNPWEYGFLTYQNTTQDYKNYKEYQEAYRECRKEGGGKKCTGFEDIYKFSEKGLGGILLSENVFPPSVRINEYRSAIIEPSYAIESSLDINVVKNIQLLLSPTIVRKDSLGETIRQTPLVLPVGYWLMRVIVAKGPQEISTGKGRIVSAVVQPLKSFYNWLLEDSFFSFKKQYEDVTARWKHKESFEDSYGHLSDEFIKANNDVLKEMGSIVDTHYREPEELKTYNASDFQNGCKQDSRVPCFSKEDYISHFDSVVFSENGVISSFVKQSFNVEHFRHLGSKNSVIIELYPTDPSNYEYLPARKNRGNHCVLNVDKTEFYPYQTCGDQQTDNNCHAMQVPSHWGLFFTTEVANANILYPIGKDSYKAFDLPPVGGLKFEPKVSTEEKLKFDHAQAARSELSSPDSQDTIEKAAADFYDELVSELVDTESLFIDLQRVVDYCSLTKTQYTDLIGEWNIFSDAENDLMSQSSYEKKKQISALSLRLCVCEGKTTAQEFHNIENGYEYFFPRIKQCIAVKSFSDRYHKQTADILQEKIINNEVKDFCSDFRQTAKYETQEVQDYSEGFLGYRECVCDESSEGSLTQKMAECFSKDQGLHLVNNSDQLLNLLNKNAHQINQLAIPNRKPEKDREFTLTPYLSNSEEAISSGTARPAAVEKLRAMPELDLIEKNDLPHIIQKGFLDGRGWVRKNNKALSFIHSMCGFWFNDFYDQYMSFENIENFYNRFVPKMEFLNEIHPDNWRVDVEAVSSSSDASVLRKLRKLHQSSNASYNPFDLKNVNLNQSNQMEHPYWKCLSNPFHFFHIERKVMVGDLASNSEGTKYKNGRVYTFMTQAARGSDARYEWSRRNSFAISTKLNGDIGLNQMRGAGSRGWFGRVANWFRGSVGASAGAGAETSKNQTESDSNRTSRDHSRSVTLAVNHVTADITLKKHRSCMVIRPKASAFDGYSDQTLWKDIKSSWFSLMSDDFSEEEVSLARLPYTSLGLMICDDEKFEELPVEEDYYYVHQFFGGHAYEFMSRTIYHNRPYTEVLRGREQMDRFMFLAGARGHQIMKNSEGGPWNFTKRTSNLFTDSNKVDENLISAFEDSTLDWSGFYKGIHTRKEFRDHYIYTTEGMKERDQERETPSGWEKGTDAFMNWLGDTFGPGDTITHN